MGAIWLAFAEMSMAVLRTTTLARGTARDPAPSMRAARALSSVLSKAVVDMGPPVYGVGMNEQNQCKHERKAQTEHTDRRETGPVTTVTAKCLDCGEVAVYAV